MYNLTYSKIENYLYKYYYIEAQIENLESEIVEYDAKQGYYRFIKNKGSSLEDQVIKNDEIKLKIQKIRKWQELIKQVLNNYKKVDNKKYSYIEMKYFKRKDTKFIKYKLNIDEEKQKDIQNQILKYIFFCAIKEGLLKEEMILEYAKEDFIENPKNTRKKTKTIR